MKYVKTFLCYAFYAAPLFANAASIPTQFVQTAPIPILFVQSILDFIASLFLFGSVIYLLYAGYLFFIAEGDPKKIDTAKNNLRWSIIGIGVGLLAYVLPQVIKTFLDSSGLVR
ncbi:MAG: hypothetical protein KGI50_03795 [Patescibacteria group bacterium]|nr:hypothetical protein [Patescibacteria group bacterium]MDE2438412.1 hypothetical protein [Patescibacteria group bacterium]